MGVLRFFPPAKGLGRLFFFPLFVFFPDIMEDKDALRSFRSRGDDGSFFLFLRAFRDPSEPVVFSFLFFTAGAGPPMFRLLFFRVKCFFLVVCRLHSTFPCPSGANFCKRTFWSIHRC